VVVLVDGTYHFDFNFRHHGTFLNNLPYFLYSSEEIMVVSPQVRSFDGHESVISSVQS